MPFLADMVGWWSHLCAFAIIDLCAECNERNVSKICIHVADSIVKYLVWVYYPFSDLLVLWRHLYVFPYFEYCAQNNKQFNM